MTNEKLQQTDRKDPTIPSTAVVIWATFADTTWRLFVPSVGGCLLGVWADKSWQTTPLMIVIGTAVGCALAIWLVMIQLKKVKDA